MTFYLGIAFLLGVAFGLSIADDFKKMFKKSKK